MIRVGWDAQGHVAFVYEGTEELIGENITVIADGLDPYNLWRSPSGEVLERQLVSLTVSKKLIHADNFDEAVISGLPTPCVLKINNKFYDVNVTEFGIRSPVPGTIRVELCHALCGQLEIDVQSYEVIWETIRQERSKLLTECDWTQIPDADLTSEQKQAWTDYRKALRDLPKTQPSATIETLVWPDRPAN